MWGAGCWPANLSAVRTHSHSFSACAPSLYPPFNLPRLPHETIKPRGNAGSGQPGWDEPERT